MKFKRVYLIGGIAGKDDPTDYVVGYKAENGLYIEIENKNFESLRWYAVEFNGVKHEYDTLAEAKAFCESVITTSLTPDEKELLDRVECDRCGGKGYYAIGVLNGRPLLSPLDGGVI
jgi:hypothetical protein